jgi:hypothetical protein
MCLICVDLSREKLTSMEARRNLGEVHTQMKKKHILEVLRKIWAQEEKELKAFDEHIKDCDA